MSSAHPNRDLLPRIARGIARNAMTDRRRLRGFFVRDLWAVTKRFGAVAIEDVYPNMVAGLGDQVISAPLDEFNRAVLAGLCRVTGARTLFEFGTHRGLTTWTLAHNNPALTIHTLDVPPGETLQGVELDVAATETSFSGDGTARGEAFRDTPEAGRIVALYGDSATFDYSPYEGSMDFIYIDGGHSYEYVMNDTRAALRMLSPGGTIAWDDYPSWPGVYAALTELAPTLPGKAFHILTTRLVICSESDLLKS